jgi:hypothetical protein
MLQESNIILNNITSELLKENISREMKKECVIGLLKVKETIDNQIKELVKDIESYKE